MGPGKWIIRRDTGEPWIAGMMLSAFQDLDGKWLSFAVCSRCYAMVLAEQEHAYGDQQRAHMMWHAATDFPIPEELL